jgi:hypothetical protein
MAFPCLLMVQNPNTAHLCGCAFTAMYIRVDYGWENREIEIGMRNMLIWDEEEWEITLRLSYRLICR